MLFESDFAKGFDNTKAERNFQNIFRQSLTRFSTTDWFLTMLKISTEHGSTVPVGSCFGNRKQHGTKSSGKLFLLFIVTNLLPLPGLARKSVKHDFFLGNQ